MVDEVYPLVYIVVLNWNGWQDTLECLASLHALAYPNFQVVIVDNGSSDDSEACIRRAAPHVTILQTGANLGFARGNNLGLSHALEHGAEYVWLLNNDALVQPDTLRALVRSAQMHPEVGFFGSKIVYADHPDLIWFAGGTVMLSNGAAGHVAIDQSDPQSLPAAGETAFATGCSLLVRRQVIEEIGGLPDAYFLYYEDVDWQFVGHRRGWTTRYEPDSVVLHKISATSGRLLTSPAGSYQVTRSRLIFVRRHLHGALWRCVAYTVRAEIAQDVTKREFACAYGALRGLVSGLTCAVESSADRLRTTM